MEQARQRKNGHPAAEVDRDDASPVESLSPERFLELRRMIEAREYDRPEMIDEVARRILERGDL